MQLELIDLHPTNADVASDVLAGLRKPQKALPAKYFYDERGSRLFEEITGLSEYYLTRTEISILRNHARDIAQRIGKDSLIIELGSGNCTKIRILLDAAARPVTYMPVDLSREFLETSAQTISSAYQDIEVVAVLADYTEPFEIPRRDEFRKRIVFFPGSTIGNLDPSETKQFLARLGAMLLPGDELFIGVDTKKERAVLHAAYNDAKGVTEEFNRNILRRVNEELGADFDLSAFRPVAFYNEDLGRIEMHLVSERDQRVTIGESVFYFREEETIHTENSYKYAPDEFRQLALESGLRPRAVWTDSKAWFTIHALEVGE